MIFDSANCFERKREDRFKIEKKIVKAKVLMSANKERNTFENIPVFNEK
jgi:hypothetical protein